MSGPRVEWPLFISGRLLLPRKNRWGGYMTQLQVIIYISYVCASTFILFIIILYIILFVFFFRLERWSISHNLIHATLKPCHTLPGCFLGKVTLHCSRTNWSLIAWTSTTWYGAPTMSIRRLRISRDMTVFWMDYMRPRGGCTTTCLSRWRSKHTRAEHS